MDTRPPQRYYNYQRLIPLDRRVPLRRGEFGVRSDLRGQELNNLINRVTNLLIYRNYNRVTLKARSKGIEKLCSIVDILRNKIVGIYTIQKNYSNRYRVPSERNRTIRLPCMDCILTFQRPNNFNMSFMGPKPRGQMRRDAIGRRRTNFVRKRFNRQGRGFRAGFRGRGFNRRGNFNRGRGRFNRRGNNGNNRGGNNRGNNVLQRGRGGQREMRIRGGQNNNNGYNNNMNSNNRGRGRGRGGQQ